MSYKFFHPPERPARTPVLRVARPYCSECTTDLVWDDDSYICPTCGSSFSGEEDGQGIPYPDWSGEQYAVDVTEPTAHEPRDGGS